MPDMHEGYGFPVGGVAATLLPDGAISPGGIGFDINCGVRLLRSSSTERPSPRRSPPSCTSSVEAFRREPVVQGACRCRTRRWTHLLGEGVPYLVREHGLVPRRISSAIESGGSLPRGGAPLVSSRAKQRGHDQLGTLGSGNHFLEVQVIDTVYRRWPRARARARCGSSHRPHSHRIARARSPSVHRLRARAGCARAPLRNRSARQAARVRAAFVSRRPPTSPPCAPLRISDSRTDKSSRSVRAECSRENPRTGAQSFHSSTTSAITPPKSSDEANARSACIARARRVRSARPAPTFRRRIAASDSLCSFQAAWAPRRSCSSARMTPPRSRWVARVTGPGARSAEAKRSAGSSGTS